VSGGRWTACGGATNARTRSFPATSPAARTTSPENFRKISWLMKKIGPHEFKSTDLD